MTPQPQEPRDNERQQLLAEAYSRSSRYVDARTDSLGNRIEVVEQHMTRLEGNQQQTMVLLMQMQQQQREMQQQQAQMQQQQREMQQQQQQMQQQMTRLEQNQQQLQQQQQEMRDFQQLMLDTFKAFGVDIQKQMADGFALLSEQIAQLTVRVERLERRDDAPQA